jgi:outer membrane protein TolC
MGILGLLGRGPARRTLSAALALPLAGCAVGPDFVPPAVPITDKFLGARGGSIKSSHQDYRDWWRTFHDPTLNQLVQIAYDQNLTLLSAGTRVL